METFKLGSRKSPEVIVIPACSPFHKGVKLSDALQIQYRRGTSEGPVLELPITFNILSPDPRLHRSKVSNNLTLIRLVSSFHLFSCYFRLTYHIPFLIGFFQF
jgi:hypothetical protein